MEKLETKETLIQHSPDREIGFTMINNHVFKDRNLKDGLLEVLCYLLSKPPTWQTRIQELCSRFDVSKRTMCRRISQLTELGYLSRSQQKNPDGTFSQAITYVCDRPIYKDDKQPCAKNRMSVNGTLSNKELIKKEASSKAAKTRARPREAPKKMPRATSAACLIDKNIKSYVSCSTMDKEKATDALPDKPANLRGPKPIADCLPAAAVFKKIAEMAAEETRRDALAELPPAEGCLPNKLSGGLSHKNDLSNSAYGQDQLLGTLVELLQERITSEQLIQLIQNYGVSKVDSACRFVAANRRVENIANLDVYLDKAIREDWSSQKTSPRPQKQPYTSNPNQKVNQDSYWTQETDKKPVVGHENEIDRLRRLNYWSLEENKTWYLGLSQALREKTLEDVLRKWPWLIHAHHKSQDWERLGQNLTRSFILSNDFIDNLWFKQFASVVNDLRLEEAAHSLRSRIWAEGIDT